MACTIVLRHADREDITSREQAPFAKLTLKGRLKAIQHGLWLGINFGLPKEVYSSKTIRCIETAKIITLPFVFKTRVKMKIDDDYYGFFSTGYIKDGKFDAWMEDILARAHKKERYAEMFARWSEKGLIKCTLHEYGRNFLSSYLTPHNLIAITHDSVIGPLMEALAHEFGFRMRDYMLWPNPLAGFCIEHENQRIYTIKWLEFGGKPQVLL
ncbi:MAG: histidine phosphatase family protein [Candidatus Micrarchaeota archaeon]|nr:histidine phosphatase family protein [Candidatus Micrarchaeota archaeon]